MFGVIMPLCNRMFCCIFGWYFYIEIRLKYEKLILLFSSRAFSLSTPTFSFSTPVDHSEATWKIATKCNKLRIMSLNSITATPLWQWRLYWTFLPQGLASWVVVWNWVWKFNYATATFVFDFWGLTFQQVLQQYYYCLT